jgi:hypothetical protein
MPNNYLRTKCKLSFPLSVFQTLKLYSFLFCLSFLYSKSFAQTEIYFDSLNKSSEYEETEVEDDEWDDDEYSIEPVVIESPLKTDPYYIYSEIQEEEKLDEKYWNKKKGEYRYVENTKVVKKQNQIKSNPFDFNKAWLKYLIYGLGISALLFVIVFLVRKFLKGNQSDRKAAIKINLADLDEDGLKALNTLSLIELAEKEGNFQMAYRLRYLEVLKQLTIANQINFKKEFTNFDYLKQVSGLQVYEVFKILTQKFDNYWYGEFEIEENDYTESLPLFEQALTLIKKGGNS